MVATIPAVSKCRSSVIVFNNIYVGLPGMIALNAFPTVGVITGLLIEVTVVEKDGCTLVAEFP